VKTTDFAMLFIAIIIPVVIVVYVDVVFLLKKEEQTLYYKNIINSVINDATYAMKNVEGETQDVDYGYSGISQKRVSVNARVAIDTFYQSLYDNFEITGDITSEEYIKSHIPAVAIVDYNGVYIYSIDEYQKGGVKHIDYMLKPKRYYTYTYAIENNTNKLKTDEDIEALTSGMKIANWTYYTVLFTMDDYIGIVGQDSVISWFYLEDENNNSKLYGGTSVPESLKEKVIQHLKIKRSEVISKIVSDEMSFAVSNHNLYSDVDYTFSFPSISVSDWDEMVNSVGIIAFIQGINLGNVKLDYVAHGISGLKVTDRYYVSTKTINGLDVISSLNYYHNDNECDVYLDSNKSFDGYYMTKTDAATNGYYPCPVCNP